MSTSFGAHNRGHVLRTRSTGWSGVPASPGRGGGRCHRCGQRRSPPRWRLLSPPPGSWRPSPQRCCRAAPTRVPEAARRIKQWHIYHVIQSTGCEATFWAVRTRAPHARPHQWWRSRRSRVHLRRGRRCAVGGVCAAPSAQRLHVPGNEGEEVPAMTAGPMHNHFAWSPLPVTRCLRNARVRMPTSLASSMPLMMHARRSSVRRRCEA